MSARVYTMRKQCLSCINWFTLSGSAQKFCKQDERIRRRRREDRLARKAAQKPKPSKFLQRYGFK